MAALIIVVLILWLVVTVIGFVFKSLLWLAIIGMILFIGTGAALVDLLADPAVQREWLQVGQGRLELVGRQRPTCAAHRALDPDQRRE